MFDQFRHSIVKKFTSKVVISRNKRLMTLQDIDSDNFGGGLVQYLIIDKLFV